MKKFSLLVGALGGAVLGYLASNKKLRDALGRAKSADVAGKIFAKHLQNDGKRLGKELKTLLESDEVRRRFHGLQTLVEKKLQKAGSDVQGFTRTTLRSARKNVTKAAKQVRAVKIGG